ncbi:lysozyme [Candidatus Sneabacter namystus]|uniref:Lysozyme n=1 Tax=Candidatus Sneabacter namystus TaxID=2601646 RepID=A0A5C0UIT8_9RICK|nr:lysozyme [Candidatus Sneabacter namystus]QEK39531.1 lysozyme [Candidatus Sneabacter namystus]
MLISNFGLKLIKIFESLSLKPYKCSGGYYTIGYGHKMLRPDQYTSIDDKMAETLLIKDISKAEASVIRNIKVDLSQEQLDALVSFTFNVGGAALQRSQLKQKINSDNKDNVKEEFLKWTFARGKRITGLIRRREIEAEVFLGRQSKINITALL